MTSDNSGFAVALGGGGARGFAHIGILEALKTRGLRPAAYAGTSVGAIVGAAYAANREEALIDKLSALDFGEITRLMTPSWPRQGFFTGKRFLDFLAEVIPCESFADLDAPFAAITVDLMRYERHVFTEGALHPVLRASSSIPILFKPVYFDDKILVDGGLIDPIPVESAWDFKPKKVLAIDLMDDHESTLSAPPKKQKGKIKQQLKPLLEWLPIEKWQGNVETEIDDAGKEHAMPRMSMTQVAMASLNVMQNELAATRLAQHRPDYVCKPPVGHIGILDFHKAEEEIDTAFSWAQKYLDEITEALER